MKMHSAVNAVLVSVLVPAILTACDGTVFGGAEPSFFVAFVEDGRSYEGAATFNTGMPGGLPRFQLSSDAAAQGWSFALTRWDGGRLPVGTYPMSLVDFGPDHSIARPTGMSFLHFYQDGDIQHQYVALSGTLEITSSSSTRVAGHFTIEAVRYCRVDTGQGLELDGPCNLPAVPLAEAPRITATGSFSATPLKVGPLVFN